jgi:hypothetical protein
MSFVGVSFGVRVECLDRATIAALRKVEDEEMCIHDVS